MQQWVSNRQIKVLIEEGFNVYLLEVDSWQVGKQQALYLKRSIQSKKIINELFQ